MKLYLLRHGESSATSSNSEPTLSEKGKADIQHLANFIAPLKLSVSRLLQSSKYRAQQTAKILLNSVQVRENIETRSELQPMSPIHDILHAIYTYQQDMILVGHLPFMEKLAAQLLTGNEANIIVMFNPGSMLCLEHVKQQQWIINWMLHPELLSDKLSLT